MFNHINLRSECLSADTERWGKESKRSSSCWFHVPLITLITSLLLLWHLSHPSSKLNNRAKKFTHLEALPFLGSSFSCCNSSFFLSSLFHAACPKGRQNDRLRRTAVRTAVLLDARSDRCLVTVSLATVRTQKMRLWDPDIGKNDLDGKMKVWRIQLALFQPRHNSKELCECLIYLICVMPKKRKQIFVRSS